MADKTSLASIATPVDHTAVTTAGTTTSGTVKILWDDANNLSDILDALERAKIQMMDYQMRLR